MKKATIKNEYGEKINIKIEKDEIFIHHEDYSDDYVTISKFLLDCILNRAELISIHNEIKKMNFGHQKHYYITLINQ